MIHVQHNGESHALDPGDSSNLAELVAHALRKLDDQPRIVVRMRVNGDEVSPEGMETLAQVPLAGLSELELESEPVRDVAVRSLESSASFTTELIEAIGRSTEHLRAGRIEQAAAPYSDVLHGLSVLLFTWESAADALGRSGAPIEDLSPELGACLEVLSSAQQAEDWIRLADCLDFEITPRLERAALRARELHRACKTAA